MYTRNDIFGVTYVTSYGLVNNIARTNPQLDWEPDGHPFETLLDTVIRMVIYLSMEQ